MRMPTPHRLVPAVLAASAHIAGLSFGHLAAAAPSCVLRTEPADLDPVWMEAVARARSMLTLNKGDCRDVLLQLEPTGVRVTYTTRSGRRAVRLLTAPDELVPVLQALEVTLPPTEQRALDTPSPPPAPRKTVPPPPAEPIHLNLNALAGARLAGPGPLLAPTVGAGAALTFAHWELGVGAQWEVTYFNVSDPDQHAPHLTSLSTGISVGRRNSISPQLSLVTGATLSAAILHQEWWAAPNSEGETEREQERAQARLGAYAGPTFPADSTTRFRAVVAADVDATHLGSTRQRAGGPPALPWWGVSLAVGMESEAL